MFIEPVSGKKFFGRESVLATLHKRVNAIKGGYRQNLALAGPMLAGKSSILRHFLKSINDPQIIPVYVELAEDDFGAFCGTFMSTLLYQYLRSIGRLPEGDFASLRAASECFVPSTVAAMDEILSLVKKRKEDDAYERLLNIPTIFRNETGKKCVIVLDEFHNLSRFALKKPFQTFGKFIMIQKNTMYIVSSSQRTMLKEILAKKLSLLFGNFEVIDIDGFDGQTARSFIADKKSGADLPEDVTKYLIQVTRGNPFYIETILKKYASLAGNIKDAAGARECLLESLSELLYRSEGILHQYFLNNINFFLEKKTRKEHIPILLSLARGNRKLKSITEDLGRTDRELGKKLAKLEYMDLVSRSGVFYRIQDRLFEFWLKNVYSLKTAPVADDMDIKYIEFKNAAGSDFDDHVRFASRSVSETVTELLGSFRNDKIRVNMYERVMPQFEKIEERPVSPVIFEITGCFGKNSWVLRVKQDGMTDEHDVNALSAAKTGCSGSKIVRKVIVPLGGIEHNAFLLAKEKNIWVWDIQQFNEILQYFGKYEIIL